MPRKDWKSVSLPEPLIKRIDEIIDTKKYGWKSRANVIVYAINKLLDTHRSNVQGGKMP
jgi:metal-responsive CopG/Arc/MetJ family transcriptional regulator